MGVVPDGVLGPKTLGALNSYSEELFIAHYSLARIKHYLDIVNRDPKRYGVYLRGWLNRVFKGISV
ncbi:MAG: hypothetical protein N2504_07760 [candidate division WOR-3 bacterium]|nr:hypothetical protein [candidate division WOR-3 bacterium]